MSGAISRQSAAAMRLRRATVDDALRLFSWRNDPVTRGASRDSRVIEWPDHLQWLKTVLADPAKQVLIAEIGGAPIGTVRLEERGEATEMSWIVAPGQRRAGLGKEMVRLATSQERRRLQAVIRADNLPSIAVARAAGLVLLHSDGDWLLFGSTSRDCPK